MKNVSWKRSAFAGVILSILLIPLVEGGEKVTQRDSWSREQGYIHGVVHDLRGVPVADALVLPLPHGGKPFKTDATGTFQLPGPSKERWIEWILVRHPDRNIGGVVEYTDKTDYIRVILTPGITLKGRVSDPSGVPIEGAELIPYARLNRFGAGFGLTKWPTAEADGSFEIKALPVWPVDCSYRVRISADGYGRCWTPKRSADSEGLENVGNIILQPADYDLAGMAFDENDNPVSNATVRVTGKGQPYHTTRTDDKGRFQISGICKGWVEISAKSSPDSFGTEEAVAGTKNVEVYIRPRLGCMLPPKSSPPSLVGKSLPDLAHLHLSIDNDEIENQCILLCFVRLEQSPSRECIRQVAQKYEVLRKRGIAVLGVQTWPFNQAQLDRWLVRNRVHFPVSILQDEFHQTPEERATYLFGLQNRIPWLILTDSNHIVRYEGFTLKTLESNLEEMDNPKRLEQGAPGR